MGASAIRQKLHDYIRVADDRKVKAIYTMVEADISVKSEILDDPEYLAMLDERYENYVNGHDKGSSWDEVEQRINASRK